MKVLPFFKHTGSALLIAGIGEAWASKLSVPSVTLSGQ